MDIAITEARSDDGHLGEYTLVIDGEDAGELTWSLRNGRRAITHTGVRHEHRGQGLAALLMKRAMEDALAEGVTVQPVCSYAVRYLEETSVYDDIVDR